MFSSFSRALFLLRKTVMVYAMQYRIQKKISKLIVLCAVFFSVSSAFYAEGELPVAEEQLIDSVMDFRMKLGQCATCDEAVAKIDAYNESVQTGRLLPGISDEAKLIVDSMLVWEKYNYLYEKDIKHPALKGLITAQYEKVKLWLKTHKKEKQSKWLYTTAADILSCCMQFLPIPTAMSEGLNIKKYYDDALEIDGNMALCLINASQWYFYAPAISGGSKKKTLEMLQKAVKVSRTPAELYYSKALLSQMLFENGKKDESAKLLVEDALLLPGSRYIAHLQTINKAGYSYFYYTMNRAKVDAALEKAEVQK